MCVGYTSMSIQSLKKHTTKNLSGQKERWNCVSKVFPAVRMSGNSDQRAPKSKFNFQWSEQLHNRCVPPANMQCAFDPRVAWQAMIPWEICLHPFAIYGNAFQLCKSWHLAVSRAVLRLLCLLWVGILTVFATFTRLEWGNFADTGVKLQSCAIPNGILSFGPSL